jgi:shikimate dehydrogenase
MNKYAVMGSPISHSHSPILHAAGFEYLGIEAQYEAVDRSKLSFEDLFGYAGLSLTMPLKLDAYELADAHDDESLDTGVSNTLLISSGRITALNTDVYGVSKAIEPLDAESIQIIGTGATAKSAAIAVRDRKVFFSGRNPEKVTQIENWAESKRIEVSPSKKVDVVIDTTPGEAEIEYVDYQKVLDVAYGSNRNQNNPKLISGLEMLLHQAVLQNIAFSASQVSKKTDFEELTSVMRGALESRVGEWSNA